MNGQDQRRILMGLELSRLQKALNTMRIKLDRVNSRLKTEAAVSEGENNSLLSSKQTLEIRIANYVDREEKLRERLDAEMPTSMPERKQEVVDKVDTIELDGVTYKVVDEVYKTVRISKDGKETKQVKYISKREV